MEKLFVPYEIAVKLKEKGFDEICLAVYVPLTDGSAEFEIGESDANKKGRSLVSAPIYQQVVDWLYEKGISLEIYTCNEDGKSFNHLIRKVGKRVYEIKALDNKCVPSRNEAQDKGITEALKLLNQTK